MPFAKGNKANPYGKKGKPIEGGLSPYETVVEMAKQFSPEAMRTLRGLQRNTKIAGTTRVAAAKAILERAFGQPVTYNAAEDAQRRDIDTITDEELAADVDRLRRARAANGAPPKAPGSQASH